MWYRFGCVLSVVLLSTTAQAATRVGVVGASSPNVTVSDEKGVSRTLSAGDDIFLNDMIKTDVNGAAQLMFLDKSALMISPGSAVKIDKFVYDPASKDGTMSLEGAKGAFRFIGGALTKKKAVKIKTPVSTIGIRGGIVDTHVNAGGHTNAIFVFGKQMSMTNPDGQTVNTTQFGSGLALNPTGGLPTAMSPAMVAQHINNSPTSAAVGGSIATGGGQGGGSLGQKLDSKGGVTRGAAGAIPAAGGNDGGAAGGQGGGGAVGDQSNAGGNGGNGGGQNGGGDGPVGGPFESAGGGNAGGSAGGDPTGGAIGGFDGGGSGGGFETAALAPVDVNPMEGLTPQIDIDVTAVRQDALDDGAGKKDPKDPSNLRDEDDENDKDDTLAGGNEQDDPADHDVVGEGDDNGSDAPSDDQEVVDGLDEEGDGTDVADGEGDGAGDPNDTVAGGGGGNPPPAGDPLQFTFTAAQPKYTGIVSHVEDSASGGDDSIGFVMLEEDPNDATQLRGKTDLDHVDDNGVVTGVDGRVDVFLPKVTNYASPTTIALGDVTFVRRDAADNEIETIAAIDGQAISSAGGSMMYYDLQHSDGTYTSNIRTALGTGILDFDLNGLGGAANIDTFINTRLNDAATFSSTGAPGVIEYDFLPDFQEDGGFGVIDYNTVAGFGGMSPLTDAVASQNLGMLVDWDRQKFFTGYIDFEGYNYGSASDPETWAFASFGKINNSVAAIGASLGGDGRLNGGNLFQGFMFYHSAEDEDLDMITSADEMMSGVGQTHVAPGMVFGTDDGTASPDAIEGFVFEGDIGGETINQAVMESVTQPTLDNVSIDYDLASGALNGTEADIIHQGFTAGLAMTDDGQVTRVKSANGSMMNVTLHTDRSVTAYVPVVPGDTPAALSNLEGISQGTLQFGGSTESAVIQKDLYGAASNSAGSHGAIVAAPKIDTVQGGSLVCSTCDFAHWGVWNLQKDNAIGAQAHTNLVPYVAGKVFEGDLSAISAATHTFNGDAVGNFHVKDLTATNPDALINAHGTMTADVDFNTRTIAASSLQVDFSNIDGRTLNITNDTAMVIPTTGASTFDSGINVSFTDSSAAMAGVTDGGIQGAFFGPNAEEIGGSFSVKSATANEELTGGGIYLGKR